MSYGPEADDLACYYKSPYLFQLSGRARQASLLLEFIQRRFMCLARIISDPRCTELAVTIADHLLAIQDSSGAWLVDQPAHTTFDQTVEISI